MAEVIDVNVIVELAVVVKAEMVEGIVAVVGFIAGVEVVFVVIVVSELPKCLKLKTQTSTPRPNNVAKATKRVI